MQFQLSFVLWHELQLYAANIVWLRLSKVVYVLIYSASVESLYTCKLSNKTKTPKLKSRHITENSWLSIGIGC